MNFFRAQGKGISFEEMKEFKSKSGADQDFDFFETGVCASATPDSSFGGALDALDDDDEVVIFSGRVIEEIYDGYIVQPVKEIARFSVAEWEEKLGDGSAWEYEDWG